MLYEFYYYMALSGSLCISVVGMLYYYNRPLFNRGIGKISWSACTLYHNITTKIPMLFLSYS